MTDIDNQDDPYNDPHRVVGDLFTVDDVMCSRIVQHAHTDDQTLVELVTDHAEAHGIASAIAGINDAASILTDPPAILTVIRQELRATP